MAAYNPQLMAKALRQNIQYPTGGGTVGRPQGSLGQMNSDYQQPQQQGSMISQGTANNLMGGLRGLMAGGSNSAIAGPPMANGAMGTTGGLGGMFGGGATTGGAGAAGGASSGLGGAAAAAGPWAALAAAILWNEEDSRKKGLRAEDRVERMQDLATGKVLTQDIEGKWGPKFDKWTGGRMSKWGLNQDMKGGSQIASGRIGPGLKTLAKEGTTGKIVNALKKLF